MWFIVFFFLNLAQEVQKKIFFLLTSRFKCVYKSKCFRQTSCCFTEQTTSFKIYPSMISQAQCLTDGNRQNGVNLMLIWPPCERASLTRRQCCHIVKQQLVLCVSDCRVSLLHRSEVDSSKRPRMCSRFWNSDDNSIPIGEGMKADRWRDTNRKPCWCPVCQTPLIHVQTLTGLRQKS